MSSAKPFAIYCSRTANTVRRFYAQPRNREQCAPKVVIYDNEREDVIAELRSLFGDRLTLYRPNEASKEEQAKPHQAVSTFLQNVMEAQGIEHLLCFGEKILKANLLSRFPGGLVNFHPSLLPSFKGVGSIDQAMEGGACILGVTAHLVDASIDTGPILAQAAMLREDFHDYPDVLELTFPLIKLVLRDRIGLPLSREDVLSDLKNREAPFLLPAACRQVD